MRGGREKKGASHHLPVAGGDTAPSGVRGEEAQGGRHLFDDGVVPAAEIRSPLLIVADAAVVGRCAPGWSATLEAAGIEYRVRLSAVGPGGVAAIVAEARSMNARTIAAAGGDDAIAAGRAAAAAASVPFVLLPTGERDAAG